MSENNNEQFKMPPKRPRGPMAVSYTHLVLLKQQKLIILNHMIILSISWRRYQSIWKIQTVAS